MTIILRQGKKYFRTQKKCKRDNYFETDEVYQMDVKIEEIYMEQLGGFVIYGQENKVYKFDKKIIV